MVPDTNYCDIIVPTVNTVRMAHLLELLLINCKPVRAHPCLFDFIFNVFSLQQGAPFLLPAQSEPDAFKLVLILMDLRFSAQELCLSNKSFPFTP